MEFVGHYSPDGKYSAISSYRNWYNREASASANFSRASAPSMRPVEVPHFVNLRPQERVIENLEPPARAVKVVRRESRMSALRDRIISFAYGREQFLLAPQHVTMDSKGRVIITDPVAHAVHVLDGNSSFRIAGGERRHLHQPAGVAVDAHDNIYVADSERGVVEVYDPTGRFQGQIGKIENESLFDYPTGIAIDSRHSRLYLLDTARNLLVILDLQGNVLKRVGHRSTDEVPVDFRQPSEIAVGNSEVVVLDRGGLRIQILDLNGKLLRQFNTCTSNIAEISGPPQEMGLTLDIAGNIYVSNLRDSGVRVFDRNGAPVTTFGTPGSREGQFDHPTGIWIQNEEVLIADTNNRRVQVFRIRSRTTDLKAPLVASGK
jgi:DNA-binding beta-propeller fold protein YncE